MKLKWTTEPPTEEGWYWTKLPDGRKHPYRWTKGRIQLGFAAQVEAGYKWAGPIPAPQEEG